MSLQKSVNTLRHPERREESINTKVRLLRGFAPRNDRPFVIASEACSVAACCHDFVQDGLNYEGLIWVSFQLIGR